MGSSLRGADFCVAFLRHLMKYAILAPENRSANQSGKDYKIIQVQTKDREKQAGGRRDWLIGLALFFLAFLPRTFGLSRFLTPDEHLWIGRSVEFLNALVHADLVATFAGSTGSRPFL